MTPLRIGFASVYAWRPHVEHLMFLARLVGQTGHVPLFLTCDGDLPVCYTRELRDVRPDWAECLLCRVGGVRSYTGANVSSIGSLAGTDNADGDRFAELASSSASTLGRFESPADYATADYAAIRDRLAPAVGIAYSAAREWIRRERLDAICLFNGRMDATRGIFEAARDAGIRVVTVERSWFGDGLQLLPDETCLGLQSVHAMVREWSTRPLTCAQALQAAGRVASRLRGTNTTEWRAYNRQAQHGAWPVASGGRRILLLPGSVNEIWGHPDWRSHWAEPTAAYDALMDQLGLAPADIVLRCHPNWGERIGRNDGRLPEQFYTQWAMSRGVHVISSGATISTMGLIAQCDAVVLASGSAALEASAMGKQVIATAPSVYQEAGFRTDATHHDAVAQVVLDVDRSGKEQAALRARLRRHGLRFSYTMSHRLPQYVQHVRALSSSQYRYPKGADPQRLLEIIRTGRLAPDDAAHSDSDAQEDAVLALMEAGDWDALAPAAAADQRQQPKVYRRWLLRPMDYIREKIPVGDR